LQDRGDSVCAQMFQPTKLLGSVSDHMSTVAGVAVVVGASGQDGYILSERLLAEAWVVHAVVRRPELMQSLAAPPGYLHIHKVDLLEPSPLLDLIARTQPEECYNLAGQSSVTESFADPWYTWRTNTEVVVRVIECLRLHSPHTRFYQASSTDMFGCIPGGTVLHDETSPLNPESPYASAKAAAHLLCRSYREAYGLRIACGILSNHESRRRQSQFLSRKVVDHVRALRKLPASALGSFPPLSLGNLKIQRDWGFAPDYVEGMCRILRQINLRSQCLGTAPEPDVGINYRDYVLGTGKVHAVWQLVDRAFVLAGFDLDWELNGDDPRLWRAYFRSAGKVAVVVNPALLRPTDPLTIMVDASLARRELAWVPHEGLDIFLRDMLENDVDPEVKEGSES